MRSFVATSLAGDRGLDELMAASDAAQAGEVIDLALGDPDLDTDRRVIRAAFEDAECGYTHYAPALGDPELLAAIRTAWREDYAITLAENQMMVTASGCHAMWLLLSAVLDPHDEVVIFAPYFSPYPDQVHLAGGTPVIVDTDPDKGFVPRADALRSAIGKRTKAVIVNTPCNPTGVCLSRDQMQDLVKVCAETETLLIADEIYTAYSFGKPFVPFMALEGSKDCVAAVRSFSKDFCMSGWRLGYVVAPAAIIAAMRQVNESNVFVAPTVSQRAALRALELRADIQARVHETYRNRRAYALERIARIDGLSAPTTEGSLYVFLDIRATGLTASEFTRRMLAEASVSVIPGTAFGQAGEGFVRMALRVGEETLAQVFDRMERIARPQN
ncbi:aminotransferase class I/II-fold pyridoxal phosphate-dependent enzyme [Raoultibacter phocaeensis]|uniref:aminotransferase class I/II-fold pyridoxal phosphate-dependent enzyme n=1 Tax=Raoultibacter phocaeensis TaxID=2479841 RepID=UPI001117EA18|nr:aminotransferase class I/II-fold pyridoxal phosphate-dependent enzyme [Raoultibacter phocaeensis]